MIRLLPLALAILFGIESIHAQEPADNPTNLQFSNLKAYGFLLQFTPSNAAGFLVIKSKQYITAIPADGVVYQKGQGLGNAKVVSVGNLVSLNVREVTEGTKYYFAVFAYNGSGGSTNYKQSNPLVDSVTAPAFDATAYFSGIDSSSGNLISDLHNLIRPHNLLSYSPGYKNTIIPVIYERDTVGGQAVVNCDYSNETTVYNLPFDFVTLSYNREHAYPRSWMHTGGNTANQDGADYFNLLLTRDVPNQMRSNHPLGIVANVSTTYLQSKYGNSSQGKPVFEPRNDRKGDAARAMFYQMICYNTEGGNWGFNNALTEATDQDPAVLKQWHFQDPPDAFERTKDEYLYSIQGNRNPFIAYPGWVNCIDFDELVKTSLCGAATGIDNRLQEAQIKVYPIPANNSLTIQVETAGGEAMAINLFNLTGNLILSETQATSGGLATATINTTQLPAGNYTLQLLINGSKYYRKVVVLN